MPRGIGLVDIGIAVMVLVAVVLPPRTMYASSALKGVDGDGRYAIALAEARTIAHPDDGALAADFARRLGAANFKDWAIEQAIRGSERSKGSPSRWRALSAVSGAYADKLQIDEAFDYASRALSACDSAGPTACPAWESLPLELFVRHLDAGMKSKIDPHSDPDGFRREGESAIRSVRLGDPRPRPPAPTPPPSN